MSGILLAFGDNPIYCCCLGGRGGGEGRGGHTHKDFSPTLGTPLNNVYKCRLSGLLFNEGNKLSSILVKFLTFCLGFQLVAIYFQC